MDSHESSRLAAPLAHRLDKSANSAQIAEAIVAVWRDIDSVLTPILGHQGVVALHQRSLHLTSLLHPCLIGLHEGVHTEMDLAALKAVLAQECDLTVDIGDDLLQMFYELLASLVGHSLTERLLRPVWENSLGDKPARDTHHE